MSTKKRKIKRRYYSKDFKIHDRDEVRTELDLLAKQKISSIIDLQLYINKVFELNRITNEEKAWRFINIKTNTYDDIYVEFYKDFLNTIYHDVKTYNGILYKRILDCKFINMLPNKQYDYFIRVLRNEVNIFSEENVTLDIKEQCLLINLEKIRTALMVNNNAVVYLRKAVSSPSREHRERVFRVILNHLQERSVETNNLINDFIDIRLKKVKNVGFPSYEQYNHFDCSRVDCSLSELKEDMESVNKHSVPIINNLRKYYKYEIGLDTIRPWDRRVSYTENISTSFTSTNELIEKVINALKNFDLEFAELVRKNYNDGFIDINAKSNRTVDGSCYPLPEHKSTYLILNSVGVNSDIDEIFKQLGYMLHYDYSFKSKMGEYIKYPPEIIRMTSMFFQIITLDYIENLFASKKDYIEYKRRKLEGFIYDLHMYIVYNDFEHYLYGNVNSTLEERNKKFSDLCVNFTNQVDYSGIEDIVGVRWQLMTDLFQKPFYQVQNCRVNLVALSLYRNLYLNKDKALNGFKDYLLNINGKSVQELYEILGVPYHMDDKYIKELLHYTYNEIIRLRLKKKSCN